MGMKARKSAKSRHIVEVKGSDLLNKVIDNLPLELHIPVTGSMGQELSFLND